jgi:hypothetical protein
MKVQRCTFGVFCTAVSELSEYALVWHIYVLKGMLVNHFAKVFLKISEIPCKALSKLSYK